MRTSLPLLVLVSLALIGCSLGPSLPPGSPQPNVWFVDAPRMVVVSSPVAVLRAVCASCQEYGSTRGQRSVLHYYLLQFDVEAVESGNWTDQRVVFITNDSVPSSNSGLVLDQSPWPYRTGTRLRLWLDTSKPEPLLIAQQLIQQPPAPGG